MHNGRYLHHEIREAGYFFGDDEMTDISARVLAAHTTRTSWNKWAHVGAESAIESRSRFIHAAHEDARLF